MTCIVGGCDRPTYVRGFCSMHYQRVRKHGDPHYDVGGRGLSEVDRFWRLVDRRGPGECWLWLGSLIRGYGQFSILAAPKAAHRYAYELMIGPIPKGLTLDHLCHSNDPTCLGGVTCLHRRCVNPAHLEPIERGANVLRGRTIPAMNAAKTECYRGHPFDEANTRIDPRTGDRICRTCARENAARYRASPMPPIHDPTSWGTHCRAGHEFTPENTAWTALGARRCRICGNRRQREYQARKRAAAQE